MTDSPTWPEQADTPSGEAYVPRVEAGTPGGEASVPHSEPEAPPEEEPRPPRRWRRRLMVTFAILVILSLGALSAYLWTVNDQWISQNDELRAETTEIGAQLAQAQTSAIEAESALETTATQLDNATARISDLANEEANANDSVQFLENLIDALISCADERQSHIVNISRNGLSYANSNARVIENQITEFCDGVEESYENYLDEKDA